MTNPLHLTAYEEQKLAALEAGFSGGEEAEDLLAVLEFSESSSSLHPVHETEQYPRRPRTPSDFKSSSPFTEDQQAPQGRAVVLLDVCPLASAENAARSEAQAKEQGILSAPGFPITQGGTVQGIDSDELASNGKGLVRYDGKDAYLLQLTHREVLLLHSALSRDREEVKRGILKGVCVEQDLRSTDSAWDKLQDAYFAGFFGRAA